MSRETYNADDNNNNRIPHASSNFLFGYFLYSLQYFDIFPYTHFYSFVVHWSICMMCVLFTSVNHKLFDTEKCMYDFAHELTRYPLFTYSPVSTLFILSELQSAYFIEPLIEFIFVFFFNVGTCRYESKDLARSAHPCRIARRFFIDWSWVRLCVQIAIHNGQWQTERKSFRN